MTNDFIQNLEGIKMQNRQVNSERDTELQTSIKNEPSIKDYVLESLEEYEREPVFEAQSKPVLFQNLMLKKEFEGKEANGTEEINVIEKINVDPNSAKEISFTKNESFGENKSEQRKIQFNKKLEHLFLRSVEHEHKELFFQKNRIVNTDGSSEN